MNFFNSIPRRFLLFHSNSFIYLYWIYWQEFLSSTENYLKEPNHWRRKVLYNKVYFKANELSQTSNILLLLLKFISIRPFKLETNSIPYNKSQCTGWSEQDFFGSNKMEWRTKLPSIYISRNKFTQCVYAGCCGYNQSRKLNNWRKTDFQTLVNKTESRETQYSKWKTTVEDEFYFFFILHPNKKISGSKEPKYYENSFFFISSNDVCLCCSNILYLNYFLYFYPYTVSCLLWFKEDVSTIKNFFLLQIKAKDFLFHLIWTGVKTRETYPRKQTKPFIQNFHICRQLVWYLHGNDVYLIHLLHIVSSNHTLRYWMKLTFESRSNWRVGISRGFGI